MPDDLVDARFRQNDIATDSLQVRIVHLIAESLLVIDLFPYSSLRQLKWAESLNGKPDIVLQSGEWIVEDRVGWTDV